MSPGKGTSFHHPSAFLVCFLQMNAWRLSEHPPSPLLHVPVHSFCLGGAGARSQQSSDWLDFKGGDSVIDGV